MYFSKYLGVRIPPAAPERKPCDLNGYRVFSLFSKGFGLFSRSMIWIFLKRCLKKNSFFNPKC